MTYITDTVADGSFVTDLDNQSANNYLYDANGNIIKDVKNGIDTVIYDYRNLPLQIKKSGVITTYRYDANGNRVYKSTAGGSTYYYLVDLGGRTVAVLNNIGDPKMLNIWGIDHVGYVVVGSTQQSNCYWIQVQCIQSATQLGKVNTAASSGGGVCYEWHCDYYTVRSDARYFYLKDHLGTIKMTVDASGNVTSYDDYYPYGMVMEGRSGNFGQGDTRYKFTSKERDVETGYDYFGARYYDSRIGRWMSVDPLVEKYPSLSPYNYSANNPIRNADVDGADWWDAVKGGVNAALGAVSPQLGTTPSEYTNGDRGDYRAGYVAVSAAILVEGTKATAASLLTGGGEAAALLLAPETGGGSVVVAGSALAVGAVAGVLSKNAGENLTNAMKSENTNPYKGPVDQKVTTVDKNGNAIQVKEGEKINANKNGEYQQVIGKNGKPTGVRKDSGHKPKTHSDPRSQKPHGHVPDVTNPDGTPWLPIKE